MPTNRFILLLVLVISAAGLSIWAGYAATQSLNLDPVAWVIAGPALLVTWVVFRLANWVLRPKKSDNDTDG